ncbi:hypothetical protein MCC02034_18030 [Bifidobacteriaceae bacterium MCC02034]|nr:hypothetical protein MCC02034_18030 [Bifidobacteriaceae bacterium MCC02034]
MAQVGEHDTRLWRLVRHYVDEARPYGDYTGVQAIGIDGTAAKAATASLWSPTRRSATWSAWCRARTRIPSNGSCRISLTATATQTGWVW